MNTATVQVNIDLKAMRDECEREGREMSLDDFLAIEEEEQQLDHGEYTWFVTFCKFCGYIKNPNVLMDDKIKAFVHISPIIKVKCNGEDDAKKQITDLINKFSV